MRRTYLLKRNPNICPQGVGVRVPQSGCPRDRKWYRGHRLLLGHGDMDGWWPLDVALSSLRAVSTHWIAGPAVGPSRRAASPAFDPQAPASGQAAASGPLGNSESAPAPASVVLGLVGILDHNLTRHTRARTGKHQS